MEVNVLNDWFEWNGVRCTTKGIHVSVQPDITVPSERVSFTDVPGRSGSLTVMEDEDTYDDMILAAECFISDPAGISEIAGYLKGSGRVTFANRQGGFYYARIVNQIPFTKILRGNPHRSFTVNFRCKPFFYLNDSQPVTLTQSMSTLTNPGTVYARPIITVNGSGEITLMVGTQIVELSDIASSIVIDSELEEAYLGSTSMNECMTGEFPRLKPGMNAISWSGDVSSLVIQPNWRTL